MEYQKYTGAGVWEIWGKPPYKLNIDSQCPTSQAEK